MLSLNTAKLRRLKLYINSLDLRSGKPSVIILGSVMSRPKKLFHSTGSIFQKLEFLKMKSIRESLSCLRNYTMIAEKYIWLQLSRLFTRKEFSGISIFLIILLLYPEAIWMVLMGLKASLYPE